MLEGFSEYKSPALLAAKAFVSVRPYPIPGDVSLKFSLISFTCSGGRAAPPPFNPLRDDISLGFFFCASTSSYDIVGTPVKSEIFSLSIKSKATSGSHLCMSTVFLPTGMDNKNMA